MKSTGIRRGSQTLDKGLAALETLAEHPTALTAGELAQALKFARPTVYRILTSLVASGFVTHDQSRGVYRPSFKLLDLGHRLLQSTDLLEASRPVLQHLHAQCRETVHLAVPEAGRMVYLDKLEGAGPFCMYSRIGA